MSWTASGQRSDNLCPRCYVNPAERYCSECGQVFCLQCAKREESQFYVCSRCGADAVEEGKDGAVCKKCGEPARPAVRRVFLCPNCGSSNVTPIHNKRQELVSQFRTTYYRLRRGHELLAGFVGRLRALRWRVKELRMGGFLHDPEIEKRLMELVTHRLPSVQERIIFRAQGVVERHQSSKEKFIHPELWAITDFPLLAGLMESIEEDMKDYESYCQALVEELDGILSSIEEHLAPLEHWHRLFTYFADYLDLKEGEHPVAAIRPVSLDKTSKGEGMSNGVLFVTTRRLIFLGQKGFLSKDIRVVRSIPLAEVEGVAEEGRFRRRLLLTVRGEEELKLSGSTDVLQQIRRALTLATNFAEYSLVNITGSLKVTNLKVDLTPLRDELERLVSNAITPDFEPHSAQLSSLTLTFPSVDLSPSMKSPSALQVGTTELREQDPLFRLRQQQYSIQATMSLLERQFEEGKISEENFFKQYRALTSELFRVESRIRELTSFHQPGGHSTATEGT